MKPLSTTTEVHYYLQEQPIGTVVTSGMLAHRLALDVSRVSAALCHMEKKRLLEYIKVDYCESSKLRGIRPIPMAHYKVIAETLEEFRPRKAPKASTRDVKPGRKHPRRRLMDAGLPTHSLAKEFKEISDTMLSALVRLENLAARIKQLEEEQGNAK